MEVGRSGGGGGWWQAGGCGYNTGGKKSMFIDVHDVV